MRASNILVAVTGGIAAYKIASLVRLYQQNGHNVRVIMTKGGCAFITPLTFQALTGKPVATDLLDERAELGMGHIELAKWADVLLIAPASANTIGKLACGLADNLVTSVCLATAAPILLAPAMNQQMWANALVQDNLAKLARFGYHIITPEAGAQACGDVGVGRLPAPESLLSYTETFLWQQHNGTPLMGKTVVITAGATVEAIDPVRFLSNHSTGKMGYALAAACRDAGAKVLLVAGRNVSLPTPFGVQKITVGSADELLQACLPLCAKADVLIATAAVADFKMAQIAPQKIKKTAKDDSLQLTLCQNPDVLATMSATYPALFCVGFAAETHEVQRYAQDKLRKKNLAMIVCNDVSDKSIGFASDDNAVTVFFARHFAKAPLSLPKATKRHIAEQLVLAMSALLPTNA